MQHEINAEKVSRRTGCFEARNSPKYDALTGQLKIVRIHTMKTKSADASKPLRDGRQERFCNECIAGITAAEAARRAGCSGRTGRQQGSRLLTEDGVSRRVAWLRQQVSKANVITQQEALAILTEQARSKLSHFATIGADGAVTWIFDRRQANNGAVGRVRIRNGAVLELELHDPRVAIEAIANVLGWKEAHRIDVTSGGKTIRAIVAEAEARARELRTKAEKLERFHKFHPRAGESVNALRDNIADGALRLGISDGPARPKFGFAHRP